MSRDPGADVNQRWLEHLRRKNRTTKSYCCIKCKERPSYPTSDALFDHALLTHSNEIPPQSQEIERQSWRAQFEKDSLGKVPTKEDIEPRREYASPPLMQPSPQGGKRPLFGSPAPPQPTRSLSGLPISELTIGTPRSDVVNDASSVAQDPNDPPGKRRAIGDGISTGSGSPRRENSSSPTPRRTKARPTSAPYGTASDMESRRGPVGNKQIWIDGDSPLARSAFKDSSNIASIQAAKARVQPFQQKGRNTFQSSPQPAAARIPPPQAMQPSFQQTSKDEHFDIILQPATRLISQEQLVAEVKGIYAGLVMVEAKCIEVDNKQATLAQADPSAQPKLNNEQWQALIALHRTLLHEHHDFFLASQHPSASLALRRLASKYAMPARMWRHGIHSFLELLRHRLPASLDHMLSFIYLAYSMMALLYETVRAFEDTWIECLGDLGRYRMAIEDDDIRDREVWTGVARHWYSKASDKAPTTGRLYHHLAILARPNALQQLFFYSKSLCVVIPFTSARESILTLFEPVLKEGQSQYRLPPLDTAFVKAHGLLFTNRDVDKFDPTVKEFLGLLDNQIGRVTRKFMEQGYCISVANAVATLGFAAANNPIMKAMQPEQTDVEMTETATDADADALAFEAFKKALNLTVKTFDIVLQRIGDPNVLPFIHVSLVWLRHMAGHPRAMRLLEESMPWEPLALFMNTLLAPYSTLARIESPDFPKPVKDDVRPFTEDFAIRGLLWADNYYPENWFSNDKLDDEEKYLEVASMTDERKERCLWLAVQVTRRCNRLAYSGPQKHFSIPSVAPSIGTDPSISRSSTVNSATTVGGGIEWSDTWQTRDAEPDDGDINRSAKPFGDPRTTPDKISQ